MHLEYIVSERLGRWTVRRGSTSPLEFPSRDAALKAAENLAKASAESGDTAVVKLMRNGAVEAGPAFFPSLPKTSPRVRYDPERDMGVHRYG